MKIFTLLLILVAIFIIINVGKIIKVKIVRGMKEPFICTETNPKFLVRCVKDWQTISFNTFLKTWDQNIQRNIFRRFKKMESFIALKSWKILSNK